MVRKMLLLVTASLTMTVLALAVHATLNSWRLDAAISSTRALLQGTTEPWQMQPEFWANVQGSFSLHYLLAARRNLPNLWNLHDLWIWLGKHFAFWLILSAAFASIATVS